MSWHGWKASSLEMTPCDPHRAVMFSTEGVVRGGQFRNLGSDFTSQASVRTFIHIGNRGAHPQAYKHPLLTCTGYHLAWRDPLKSIDRGYVVGNTLEPRSYVDTNSDSPTTGGLLKFNWGTDRYCVVFNGRLWSCL